MYTSPRPVRIPSAENMIDFIPDGHAMLSVIAGTSTGIPAYSIAERAEFTPLPAWRHEP